MKIIFFSKYTFQLALGVELFKVVTLCWLLNFFFFFSKFRSQTLYNFV